MPTQTHMMSPIQALATCLIFAVGLIAIPAYFTCLELAYWQYGVTTEAKVTGKHRGVRGGSSRSGTSVFFVVDYTFQETGGRQRDESDEFGEDVPMSSSGQATVEYIPGWRRFSRIQGHQAHLLNLASLWLVFGTGGAVMGWVAWKQWRSKNG